MKDFSSTCNQLVTADTCNNELDTNKYLNNNFCLIRVGKNMRRIDILLSLDI